MMAIPRSPKPPRGVGPFQQLAERRGREIEKLRAELEQLQAERDDDLCILAAYLLPNQRPAAEWTAIIANHFGTRAQALMADADRFAAARFRVDHARAGVTVPAECDCDCQPGQPCLCPERDCYCGPCPVCDRDEASPTRPETGA